MNVILVCVWLGLFCRCVDVWCDCVVVDVYISVWACVWAQAWFSAALACHYLTGCPSHGTSFEDDLSLGAEGKWHSSLRLGLRKLLSTGWMKIDWKGRTAERSGTSMASSLQGKSNPIWSNGELRKHHMLRNVCSPAYQEIYSFIIGAFLWPLGR